VEARNRTSKKFGEIQLKWLRNISNEGFEAHWEIASKNERSKQRTSCDVE